MKSRRSKDFVRFVLVVAIVILVNIIGSLKFFRIDLTAEKRYSLSDATKNLLESFDEILYVKIYLEGDFPAGFQRLHRESKQMLDEFRAYNPRIEYEFINPDEGEDVEINDDIKEQLQFKGLKPYKIQVNDKGGTSTSDVFPGAIMSYGDKETPVLLLLDQIGVSPESQINSSIQTLEFTFANAIRSLVVQARPTVGFLQGHDELEPRFVADFARTLYENYDVDKFDIRKYKSDSTGEQLSLLDQQRRLNRFDALIVAKPKKPFSDLDKFLVDQYVMNGGKVIWLVDAVHAEMDSLTKRAQFLAYPIIDQLRISDMLFKYGVRINTNVVQDAIAGGVSDRKSINKWVYFPLIMPQVKHPITKDLNAIQLNFASTVDTIIAKGIKKTILMKTSPYSMFSPTPHMVNLGKLYNEPPQSYFNKQNLPVGVLLEGNFESAFKNRLLPKERRGEEIKIKEKGDYTQMLVIGDGDIIRNQLSIVDPNIPKGTPLPLGYDQYTGQQYGNRDLLLNAVDYMLDDSGLISIRSRELKLRLLNPQKIKTEKGFWKLLNTIVPVLLIVIMGVVLTFLRKRKYA